MAAEQYLEESFVNDFGHLIVCYEIAALVMLVARLGRLVRTLKI